MYTILKTHIANQVNNSKYQLRITLQQLEGKTTSSCVVHIYSDSLACHHNSLSAQDVTLRDVFTLLKI